jgi:hypothetical protein
MANYPGIPISVSRSGYMARRKTRVKKLNKAGRYGEVVISEFDGAINALKKRYKKDFPDMTLFLNFNALGKNFIFQKIQSYPLKSISVFKVSKSILLSSEWRSEGALGYLMPKKYFDIETKKGCEELEWDDIPEFGPKRNMLGGGVRGNRWVSTEKQMDDLDSSVDIRIDSVKSVNMYEWGFEIIGEVISLLAVKSGEKSPRLPKKITLRTNDLTFSYGKDIGNDNLTVRWSEPGFDPRKQEKIYHFDKILFGDDDEREEVVVEEEKIKDLGQRCMKNIILDD